MATKTVYQTDPTSGIYLFTTQANELALARGFMFPSAPTRIRP